MFARPENLNTIFIIIQEQLWDQVPILQRLRECYNLKKMVEVDVRYLLNQFSRTMDLTCFSTTRRVQAQCMEITYNSDCQIGKTMFNQIGTNFDLLTKATCLDIYNNYRAKKTINAVGNWLKSIKCTKCPKFHYHKSEKCHETRPEAYSWPQDSNPIKLILTPSSPKGGGMFFYSFWENVLG